MPRPIFVHALLNDAQTRDATITLHQFEKWEVPFNSLAIFSDQETISRKVLARFSDVCDKQFSNLTSNQDRIETFHQRRYLNERLTMNDRRYRPTPILRP